MTDKSITDRERLARLIAPTEWQFSVGAAGSLLLADRILAALPEMGWVKPVPRVDIRCADCGMPFSPFHTCPVQVKP